MLSFLGRFARGVFQYFSTSLDELTKIAIDFFMWDFSQPTIAAQTSAPSEKATVSPTSALRGSLWLLM
jgi:hypothetical protein